MPPWPRDARDLRAVGVRAPVDLAVHPFAGRPSFLIDLLPQGAARKRLERAAPAGLTDWELLERGVGLRVTAELPEFIDGALLIPRFDRKVGSTGEVRLGVESVYSLTGVIDSTREALAHHRVLIELQDCCTDFAGDLLEYLRRDILNLALGNRDNHGRNTAVLKDTDGSIRLAPVFDFGPAFLDARRDDIDALVRTLSGVVR